MKTSFRPRAILLLSSLLFLACGSPPATPDAHAPDAASPDAFVATCTTSDECDDGLFCTGIEVCDDGLCARGAPVACDDAIACTRDACSEGLRRCVSEVPDLDGDGAGDADCLDASGTALGDDCNDDDGNTFVGNLEVCDPLDHDEDCNDTTLGGVDSDGDGFVDARCCNGATCGDDCNDGVRGASPTSTEVCNGIDDDCDTIIDEMLRIDGYEDRDHDGYGDIARPRTACSAAFEFSVYGTDCDDADPTRRPAQAEICDLEDNDCDLRVDESASAVIWYRDLDGDGFGSAPSGTTSSCEPPAGYSLLGTDCDDTRAGISPGSAEVCNGIDDDCSGSADYAITPGDLEDDDGDGVADLGCGLPRGLDCDDRDALTSGGAAETCDGRDNDCDSRIDEDATTLAFYRDVDGDGFGASASGAVIACTPPAGYARRGGDCNDADPVRRPQAAEGCNATDDDCDGAVDEGSAAAMCAGTPHALSTCIVGHCVVVACESPFDSCSVAAPACSTDMSSDRLHCGGCGRACSTGEFCVDGDCGPTLTSSLVGQSMNADRVWSITTDPGGDYYFTGVLGSEAFIAGNFIYGDYLGDVVVARVSRTGNVRWIQTFGDTGNAEDVGLSILLGPGALWVAGYSRSSTITLGADTFTPGDNRFHGFVMRMNPTTGVVLPGALMVTTSADARFDGLALAGGHVVAVGTMNGSGTLPVTGAVTGVAFDALAVGFDAATGVPVWSYVGGGPGADAFVEVTATSAGRVVAVGQSTGAFTFGAATTVPLGGLDIIVGELVASTGAPGWVASDGGPGVDTPGGIAVSGPNVFVSGRTDSVTGTFGAGSGGSDAIVAAHSLSTGAFVRASRFGSAGPDEANAITSDAAGHLFVAGHLGGAVDFGAGAFGANGDAFLASFDGTLRHRFATAEDVNTVDGALAVAVAVDGRMFIGGSNAGAFITGHVWVSQYVP